MINTVSRLALLLKFSLKALQGIVLYSMVFSSSIYIRQRRRISKYVKVFHPSDQDSNVKHCKQLNVSLTVHHELTIQ